MANIFSYNYERIMEENPELRYRTNPEWLAATPGAKYTTGTKGIANAYIPTMDKPLIINEKNAMYALIFAESIKRLDGDYRFFDETRNFDKMLYSLLPQDDEASQIKDPFYRRLFRRSGIKDDVRNALNSKAFKAIFAYEVISRYVCVDSALGARYTEAKIREVAEAIYEVELQEEMEKTGQVGLTTLSRCLVQERCANALKAQYGWEFSHRELAEAPFIDEDLIASIREAYPYVAQIVDEAIAALDKKANTTPSIGLMTLASTDLNPIANSFLYQRSLVNGLHINEELVGWSEDDYQVWKKDYKGESVRDEQIRDEYMHICVRDFVLKTNDKRDVQPSAAHVDRTINDITIYIRNQQIRLAD